MNLFFPYKETWLHKVNPAFKLIVFSLLFILLLFIHNLDVLINITLWMLVILLLFNGHSFKRVALFSVPFLIIFVSSSVSMIFFGEGHTTWWKWGPIHITEESFFRGFHIGLRSLNFGMLGLLLALTTKPVLLFYSLMQQLKLPPQYAYSFLASIRLIPILYEEFQTRRQALAVRGTEKKKGLSRFYHTLKLYAVPLLAQSIRRAQRIAVAMEAKQFKANQNRTFFYKTGYSVCDLVLVMVIAAVGAISYWMGTAHPYFGITDVRHYP